MTIQFFRCFQMVTSSWPPCLLVLYSSGGQWCICIFFVYLYLCNCFNWSFAFIGITTRKPRLVTEKERYGTIGQDVILHCVTNSVSNRTRSVIIMNMVVRSVAMRILVLVGIMTLSMVALVEMMPTVAMIIIVPQDCLVAGSAASWCFLIEDERCSQVLLEKVINVHHQGGLFYIDNVVLWVWGVDFDENLQC